MLKSVRVVFILFLLNVVAEFERALRVREKHISRDCFRRLRRTMHFSCRMKKIGSESTVGIKMWQVENIYIVRTVNAGDINIKHKKMIKIFVLTNNFYARYYIYSLCRLNLQLYSVLLVSAVVRVGIY